MSADPATAVVERPPRLPTRYEHFFDAVLRHPVWVLFATVLLTVLLASGARFLTFETDYRVFFSKDNPQLNAFEALQNIYTKNDNVLFVITPPDGEVFTRETLAAVQRLTLDSWQVPHSLRVDSITNFQHTEADGDDLAVGDLVDAPETLGDADLARIRAIALAEPLLAGRLIAPDARVTGVNVTVQLPDDKKAHAVEAVVAKVRAMAEAFRLAHPGYQVHLTGVVMLNNAFPEASFADIATLVPLMFALVLVTLAVLLRSVWGTLVTFVIIVLMIAATMGAAGWAGIALTGPTMSVPTIVLTLAVADCVHLLTTYLQQLRAGHSRALAMRESLRVNLQPVFLTSLTTAVGFLSMNFSEAPPFRDLGNMVAFGVVYAFLLSITFLPAAMVLLPSRVKPGETRASGSMQRLAEFVIRNQRPLFLANTALIVFAIAFIPRNELNDEFVKYFDESIEFRTHTDYTSDHLTGLYQIAFSIDSGEPNGVADPQYLERVDAFAQFLRAQPEVRHVHSFTDIMRRVNKSMHGDDPAWYRLPAARDLAAQYLLLYEFSLPFGLDLNDQLNVSKSSTRLNVTLQNLSSNGVIAFEDRVAVWMDENFPPVMRTHGSSPTVMFSHIGYRNIRSMLFGSILALVVISAILIIAFRSWRLGLVSLVPNLLPIAIAFGIWGLAVGRIGLALSVVSGMTLGIVVDDTVHFLSKYLRARRERGLLPADAVRYAFSTVGMALWITTLVLVAGFLVLAMSHFVLNSQMGLLTAITIALALAIDFLYLPSLLLRFDHVRVEK